MAILGGGFLLSLILGLLPSLGLGASVKELKDVGALGTFLGKNNAALVEFFDPKEGKEVPDDLKEVANALEGDAIAVARLPGSEDATKKYEVTTFPTLMFFVKGKPHGEEYSGERETPADADSIITYARETLDDAQEKGLVKGADGEVEELKSSRGDRLCFKAEGLCVIYLANGQPSKDDLKMLAKLKTRNLSKLAHGTSARGTTLNWSWIDATKEDGFKALLKGDSPALPGFVMYNPHKRPRYLSLEEEVEATEDSMQALLDKVLGGDGRFTPAKGQKLPKFAGKGEL